MYLLVRITFQVSFGKHHAIYLINGQAYSCGLGRYGKLGHGDERDQLKLRAIKFGEPIVCVSAGLTHSIICTRKKVILMITFLFYFLLTVHFSMSVHYPSLISNFCQNAHLHFLQKKKKRICKKRGITLVSAFDHRYCTQSYQSFSDRSIRTEPYGTDRFGHKRVCVKSNSC